jgi:hypothetical protein
MKRGRIVAAGSAVVTAVVVAVSGLTCGPTDLDFTIVCDQPDGNGFDANGGDDPYGCDDAGSTGDAAEDAG